MGVINGDTRSLDNGSDEGLSGSCVWFLSNFSLIFQVLIIRLSTVGVTYPCIYLDKIYSPSEVGRK